MTELNRVLHALIVTLGDTYDLTECGHGFRLYDNHTCPNEDCERRDLCDARDMLMKYAEARTLLARVKAEAELFVGQISDDMVAEITAALKDE